jgi:replicative DNA helicase
MNMEERNFGYLGFSFQQSLIKAIIEDKKYGENIIDVLESKYFENASFKFIMENFKELYKNYNRIPDYSTLSQKIMAEGSNKEIARKHLDTLEAIKADEQNTDYVKDTALNFCKQQNLKKELKNVNNIIENGDFESYHKIEEIIQKAMQVGICNDEAVSVFHDMDGALEADYRTPIATGIVGIDNLLKGGLGMGELGVVLAPTGTGKTTLLTKFANTAYNLGYNVVQIFFEDNPGNIKRKHYTIWSGIAPDQQPEYKEEVIEKVTEAQSRSKGSIKLLKLSSDSVTVSEIKNKIRKFNSDGNKVDLLIIDYVDCITPERSTNGEEWKGEGSIMRSLESMTGEFGMAIWTATQGNRESISSEVVTGDQMGGSIKKAQIAHVIISIGKTLEQKEHNFATLSLIKSRIGKDGVVFSNCKFNNEFLVIDTDSQSTLLGHEEEQAQKRATRAADVYIRTQAKKQATTNP